MNSVKVKICGNTQRKDVNYAINAGADSIGFIVGFPTSPRNLSIEKARSLMADISSQIEIVAVVPQDDLEFLQRISKILPIDALQLIGDKINVAYLRRLFKEKSLIKVVHADPKGYEQRALEAAENYDSILIDSQVNNMVGGTGQLHNWNMAKLIVERIKPTRTILAGGLTPFNVEEAAKIVSPYQVDVSSGVESSPGIKDHEKILQFIRNAKGGKA